MFVLFNISAKHPHCKVEVHNVNDVMITEDIFKDISLQKVNKINNRKTNQK